MTNLSQEGGVSYEVVRRVAYITFHHPAQNALPSAVLDQLEAAIQNVSHEEEVVAVLLRSAGDRTFCAGASFDELLAIHDEPSSTRFFTGFSRVVNALRKCPVPVLGLIQGKAVGGGVGIASAVDVCLATRFAAARLSELAVGFGPFVIGPAVERKIGTAAFTYMALSPAQWFEAQWCREKGLYQELFEDKNTMDTAAEALLDQWRGYAPEALKALKKVFWQGTDHWDELLTQRAGISGALALSPVSREAVMAFKAKS